MTGEDTALFNAWLLKVFKTVSSVALILLLSYLGFRPVYHVWSERLKGDAELARADSNRKIRILEAQAEQESAKALAESEIIRARGVAEANKIIGTSLENNESYLRYLWIQSLKTNQKEVVYVPTEANLPIMEAQRLKDH